MVAKNKYKSARKKFMIMRVKNSIMQMQTIPDAEVDAKLAELVEPLTKLFGEADAIEILEEAIEAADEQFTGSIQMAISDSVKEKRAKEES